MDLVSMGLLYAGILLIALVPVLCKSIRGSKGTRMVTDDGLTLKAMVGDGPKNAVPKRTPPRQPAHSWKAKSTMVSKLQAKEITAPALTNHSATRTSAIAVQEPNEVEQQIPAPLSITNDPIPVSGALALQATSVEEMVPAVVANDSSPQTGESPVQEPRTVEQITAPVFAGDVAAQDGKSPVQEVVALEEFGCCYTFMEDSVTQTSEPTAQETATVEDIVTSSVADASTLRAIEPMVQEAVAVEEIAPPFSAQDSVAPAIKPGAREAVREEIFSPSLPVPFAAQQTIPKTLLSFYGLSEQPFGVTPDPAYLYLSQAHYEASAALSEGIQNLRGFMTLIAEPGMGKTTLLNKLMEDLRDSARVVFLFQTQCNSRELLRYILGELGVPHAGMDLVAMHRALNEFLFQGLLEGRRFVLVVDEAQNLQDSTLETIRLLSDFETTRTKLLQIVLAGQPQLADKLTRPNLSQLRQRIAVVANLEPLGASETAHYIEHRLRVAGSSESIFTPEAVALIAERSQGIPRNINNICCNALQLGYAQERKTIDIDIVKKVTGKLDLELLVPKRPEQPKTAIKPAPVALASESRRQIFSGENQPALSPVQEAQAKVAKVRGSLTGKLTGLARSRPWSKDQEFKLQFLLEREPSSELSVADRYYSCSLYVSEEQAAAFQLGQPIRIKFEQD